MKIYWKELPPSKKAILVGYLFMATVFLSSAVIAAAVDEESAIDTESLRAFSNEELSAFDGQDGRPAYYAYQGLIYDVSDSAMFEEGSHFGHAAGVDLTQALSEAPHGTEVFAGFEVVGRLGEPGTEKTGSAGRSNILLFDKNLTAWTGYVFALVFILNFMSCYVMPWCVRSVPWKGKIPGPDKWDNSIVKMSYYHRYMAWLSIVFGILHGVLGIFQSFGIRI
ncbi:MAG: cytochrome b5 domain-containing protein [bacterium]|nr:cytochrome b5 domain-containing protein [bacterium]